MRPICSFWQNCLQFSFLQKMRRRRSEDGVPVAVVFSLFRGEITFASIVCVHNADSMCFLPFGSLRRDTPGFILMSVWRKYKGYIGGALNSFWQGTQLRVKTAFLQFVGEAPQQTDWTGRLLCGRRRPKHTRRQLLCHDGLVQEHFPWQTDIGDGLHFRLSDRPSCQSVVSSREVEVSGHCWDAERNAGTVLDISVALRIPPCKSD